MSGDLGVKQGEVHAGDVLNFWFGLDPKQHFAVDEALDAEIIARFSDLHAHLSSNGAVPWRDSAENLLAAIIVLDQFSRNMFRGSAKSYAQDSLALELTLSGIRRGFHQSLPTDRAIFLLMPLMHSESRPIQHFSVECFTATGIQENIRFAEAHADVIEQFGRFPSRNKVLGRESTPEELKFLSQQGAGW